MEDSLNDTAEHVIGILKRLTSAVKSRTKTVKEAEIEFRQCVSKKQVESCLADENMDSDDIVACKKILKHFFNYEIDIN